MKRSYQNIVIDKFFEDLNLDNIQELIEDKNLDMMLSEFANKWKSTLDKHAPEKLIKSKLKKEAHLVYWWASKAKEKIEKTWMAVHPEKNLNPKIYGKFSNH